jgi:hypothetical protein
LIDSIPFFEETAFGTFCNSLMRESEQAEPLTFASKPPPEQSALKKQVTVTLVHLNSGSHASLSDSHLSPSSPSRVETDITTNKLRPDV